MVELGPHPQSKEWRVGNSRLRLRAPVLYSTSLRALGEVLDRMHWALWLVAVHFGISREL